MDNKLRIGIAGGCLNAPNKTVGLNSLYYRLIQKKLKQERTITTRFHLNDYPACHLQRSRQAVTHLLTVDKVEVVIFQIRPYLIPGLNTLVWQRDTNHYRYYDVRLNPYLWRNYDAPHAFAERTPVLGRFDLNWKLGAITGIQKRASKYLPVYLQSLHDLANEHHAKIIFLGPMLGDIFPDKYKQLISAQLDAVFAGLNLPYCSLASINQREYYTDDLFHLNVAGHQRIAELLYPLLTDALALGYAKTSIQTQQV
jgi:hypothetical protein